MGKPKEYEIKLTDLNERIAFSLVLAKQNELITISNKLISLYIAESLPAKEALESLRDFIYSRQDSYTEILEKLPDGKKKNKKQKKEKTG